MKIYDCLRIFLLIIIIAITYSIYPMIEGLFVPNETQFIMYNNLSDKGHGYVPVNNRVDSKYKGFFTTIHNENNNSLEKLGIKEDDPIIYNKAPIGLQPFLFNAPNYFNDNKVIDYKDNKWEPPVNPHYKYASPDNNDAILYLAHDNTIQDNFINEHKINEKEILARSSLN